MTKTHEPEPFDVRRPFTRSDALAAGVSPKQLRGSRFRRIFRDVLVDARVADDAAVRTAAALRLHPPVAFASHFSSARMHGVPVPHHPFEHVTVWHPEDRVYRVGIACHVTKFATEDDVQVLRGSRVSRPCRMFVELASVLGLVDLVVVGDTLVRLKLVTPAELVDYCDATPAQHAGDARRAASYVRDRVDSPMESRLRMLLVLAGLPEPDVNPHVTDDRKLDVLRVDLVYGAVKVAVEYDGLQHVEDPQQRRRDRERHDWLDDHGWKLVIVTSDGIYVDPAGTIARVVSALRQRGARVPASSLTNDWRVFFPGR